MADAGHDPRRSTARRSPTSCARAKSIERELRKVIVGQHEAVRQVLMALFAGGHVLLEGVPGLGKTLLVRTLGEVLSLRFNRIQFTPDLMPADIVGTTIVSEDLDGRRALRFQAGPVFANIVLADEINRATPKTQSALLEAMQEQTVSTGEATRPLPRPFFVLATQNPLEMEGTYPLPEAQLDRFLFKVLVPFPRHTELEEILQRTIRPAALEAKPQPVANAEDVLRMLRVAREVVARAAPGDVRGAPGAGDPPQRSRPRRRRSASTCATAPARAACRRWSPARRCGRCSRIASTSSREDLQAVALPALRHRLILGFEAQADGVTPGSTDRRRAGGGPGAPAVSRDRQCRPPSQPLFEPGFVRVLESLTLAGRRVPSGRAAGQWRSRASGSSVEFSDYRTYTPGDEFRRIDWNAYARLERLFVRLYRAEEDLSLAVVARRLGVDGAGANRQRPPGRPAGRRAGVHRPAERRPGRARRVPRRGRRRAPAQPARRGSRLAGLAHARSGWSSAARPTSTRRWPPRPRYLRGAG